MANTFRVKDKVKTDANKPGLTLRLNGVVKYIACQLATKAGGRTCDRKTCTHAIKDYCWVLWPGMSSTSSYHYTDLAYEAGYGPTPPNTLPDAKDMPTIPTNEKEEKMEGFKKTVKAIMQPSSFDWNRYHGFTGSKFRRGDPREEETPKPLENDEIDWPAYRGERGTRNFGHNYRRERLVSADKDAKRNDVR